MEYAVTLTESISMPVRAGWAVLLTWMLVQLVWFRRGRVAAIKPLPPLAPERKQWAPRPPSGVRRSSPAVPPAPAPAVATSSSMGEESSGFYGRPSTLSGS